MTEVFKTWFDVLKQTVRDWVDDRSPRLGAALAYYTVFSIAPLIVIVIAIGGLWFGKQAAQDQIFGQLASLVGEQGAKGISGLLEAANKPHEGMVASALAVVTLIFGATGVFVQLQDALNTIWEVKPKPGRGLGGFLRQRLLSLAMVFGIGFLLLVSLVMSAGLAAAGKWFESSMPGGQGVWQVLNFLISFSVIAALFTLMFKYLPDVKIAWKDVWAGRRVDGASLHAGEIRARHVSRPQQRFLGLRRGGLPRHPAAVGLLLRANFVFWSGVYAGLRQSFREEARTSAQRHVGPRPEGRPGWRCLRPAFR